MQQEVDTRVSRFPRLSRLHRVKILMNERGRRDAELAQAIGTEYPRFYRWLRGQANMPAECIAALSRELETSADYILELTDDPRPRWLHSV